MPSDKRLTDSEAKAVLKSWPTFTKELFRGSEKKPWLQAQPKADDKQATTPCLLIAGSNALSTRPDGMWFRLVRERQAADVFCVEVCGSLQNLQDKRSRYVAVTSALVLWCAHRWWNEQISTNIARWQKSGVFEEGPDGDTISPIRYMKVLYALPDIEYNNFKDNGVAGGH